MPQSIVIQVGQAGNQIGARFWDLALHEQAKNNIDGRYDESLSTFFRNTDQIQGMKNIPPGSSKVKCLKARGILVDMEERVIGGIKASPLAELFDNHQYIVSNSGSGNNWGQGYHHYGSMFKEAILDSIRLEAECCDSLQSIIMMQSTGGGTGSGLGSCISELVRDELPEVWRFTVGIVPSPNDDVVTSPYNSTLSLWKLINSSDCVLPVDNQSLLRIYNGISQVAPNVRKKSSSLTDNLDTPRRLYSTQKNEAFHYMNNIVANLLLNLTCSMRFEGTMNVDINDIVTNLVPFPKLNLLSSSMAPLYNQSDLKKSTKLLDQVFTSALSADCQLLSVDPRNSLFLASALIVRGSVEISDLRRNIDRLKKQLTFVPWNQDGWKTGLCDVPPLGQQYSVLSLSNSTGVAQVLSNLQSRFRRLYSRKAHLHHYLEFMEQDDFKLAQTHLKSTIEAYEAI